MRGLALSKRGGTGPICARARPEHVFQASRANAKISLSDQPTSLGEGARLCLLAAWDGARRENMHTRSLTPSEALDAASLALEHDLCM